MILYNAKHNMDCKVEHKGSFFHTFWLLFHSFDLDYSSRNIIISNPADRVKPPKTNKKQPHHYDEDDVAKILALLKNEHIRLKAVVYLVKFAGMRLCELTGLEWKDFDFKNNVILDAK